MYIPRLLVLSLLISACVASAAAQAPSDNIPGSFYSEPLGALPPDAVASIRLIPIQPPIDLDIDHLLPYVKPETARAGGHDWNIDEQLQLHKHARAREDVTCLSIRSYRVTRDDPESDTTRLVGYSTCQPATKFQVKEAGERQAIVPR
ncbi:MAG: hypothetical protein ABSF40_14930 [Candidatus Acidiferrales bacterium]|jgi:hypothetical protein